MPRGRPRKRQWNTSGLRGRSAQAAQPGRNQQDPCLTQAEDHHQCNSKADEEISDEPDILFDSLKVNFAKAFDGDSDSDPSDIDEEVELAILDDKEFGRKLAEMVEREEEKDPD